MARERILLRFGDVDASPRLCSIACELAFWFSSSFPDRPHGFGQGAVVVSGGHRWRVHWTKARAVSVRHLWPKEAPHG